MATCFRCGKVGHTAPFCLARAPVPGAQRRASSAVGSAKGGGAQYRSQSRGILVAGSRNEVCRNWAKGCCTWGNKCAFAHPPPSLGEVSVSKGKAKGKGEGTGLSSDPTSESSSPCAGAEGPASRSHHVSSALSEEELQAHADAYAQALERKLRKKADAEARAQGQAEV